MDNIKCPVCGCTDLIGTGTKYSTAPSNLDAYTGIPLGMFNVAKAQKYVCKNCGYLMEFFSKDDVIKLQDKYGK